jgi:metal-responsive CopG/Arc/MetJ family transcriptional regulator
MSLLETKKRGRPKKDKVMDTLGVRLPEGLVRQLDEYVASLEREVQRDLPGVHITRADAIRQLLTAGLKAEEQRMHGRS